LEYPDRQNPSYAPRNTATEVIFYLHSTEKAELISSRDSSYACPTAVALGSVAVLAVHGQGKPHRDADGFQMLGTE